jgi:hypothetical protein
MTAFCSRRMRFCAAKRIIISALNDRSHFYPEIDGIGSIAPVQSDYN